MKTDKNLNKNTKKIIDHSKMNFIKNLKLQFIVFLLIFVFFLILGINYQIKNYSFPFQGEVREYSLLSISKTIFEGKNPYILEQINSNAYMYGIIPPYITAGFLKLCSLANFQNIFVQFKFLNLILVLVNTLVFLLISIKLFPSKSEIALLLSIIHFFGNLVATTNNASINSELGQIAYMLAFVLPILYNFNTKSLFLSSIFSLFGFYCKAYFILPIGIVPFIVFLFVSKRDGIILGLFNLMLLSISAIIINYLFPTYFYTSFFHHLNLTGYYPEIILPQLLYHYNFHFVIIILLLLSIIGIALQVLKKNKPILTYDGQLGFNLKDINIGFFTFKLNFYFLIFFITFLLWYFKFGGNMGSRVIYVFHLVTPFLYLSLISILDVKNKFWYVLASLGLVINCYLSYSLLPSLKLTKNEENDWKEIEKIINSSKNPYGSASFSTILSKNKRAVFDNGHNEYMGSTSNRNRLNALFVLGDSLDRKFGEYVFKLNEAFSKKKFDVVVIQRNSFWVVYPDTLIKYYNVEKTLQITHFGAFNDKKAAFNKYKDDVFILRPKTD